MKVLDATFLIDYLNGVDATAAYLLSHEEEQFILPAPAYTEVLVGEGNHPDGDVAGAKAALSWGVVYDTGQETAEAAGELADAVGPQGPSLAGMDALIAAVGRELDVPVVTADSDLLHEEIRNVIAVDAYR